LPPAAGQQIGDVGLRFDFSQEINGANNISAIATLLHWITTQRGNWPGNMRDSQLAGNSPDEIFREAILNYFHSLKRRQHEDIVKLASGGIGEATSSITVEAATVPADNINAGSSGSASTSGSANTSGGSSNTSCAAFRSKRRTVSGWMFREHWMLVLIFLVVKPGSKVSLSHPAVHWG
jgi:hypothetical protein